MATCGYCGGPMLLTQPHRVGDCGKGARATPPPALPDAQRADPRAPGARLGEVEAERDAARQEAAEAGPPELTDRELRLSDALRAAAESLRLLRDEYRLAEWSHPVVSLRGAEAALARLEGARGPHIHAAGDPEPDRCRACGRDVRDGIHVRSSEARHAPR